MISKRAALSGLGFFRYSALRMSSSSLLWWCGQRGVDGGVVLAESSRARADLAIDKERVVASSHINIVEMEVRTEQE
jgi:hypothetical protein